LIWLTISAKPSVEGLDSTRKFQIYGRRKSKPLRPRQRQLIRDLLPTLRIATKPESKIDPLRLFAATPTDVWLEIGFGGGEHLVSQAKGHPAIAFIGAEPFLNGVAKLLVAIADCNLTNIRIFDDDARLLLEALNPSSIGRVFVLYPDPWPKRRHEKRRLFNLETIAALHRVMKPAGELYFASDSPEYVSYSLRNFLIHGGFELARQPHAWQAPPPGWTVTRYESKALKANRQSAYLCFRKSP
jgi:tRNA (guanine-N7-)-methyltransferase